MISSLWRPACDGVLAALLAPVCAACRQPLDRPTGGAVCDPCWSRVAHLTPPVCDGCGDPLPSGQIRDIAAGRCETCRRQVRAVDRARALGFHQGALRDILHALKYDGRRSVVPRLGAWLRQRCGELLAGADAAVPVPLHWTRERRRGFNQAADLARTLALPVRHLLVRTRATVPQVDLPADARHENVREAFAPARGARAGAGGLVLVLVDDVTTTGATLEACARALKLAGAREVRAVTAARVVSARR
jgi:ComF family protein